MKKRKIHLSLLFVLFAGQVLAQEEINPDEAITTLHQAGNEDIRQFILSQIPKDGQAISY